MTRSAAPGTISQMRVPRDQTFDLQRERFALRHCCEDCCHFDLSQGACAHEWPLKGHRLADYARPSPDVLFCKEFELC